MKRIGFLMVIATGLCLTVVSAAAGAKVHVERFTSPPSPTRPLIPPLMSKAFAFTKPPD